MRAAPIPCMMPPWCCPSAICGLMIRPASRTERIFTISTSPVAMSTSVTTTLPAKEMLG
jgi:hypothetical protein